PTRALRSLARELSQHWLEGFGATYNPNRGEALGIVSIVSDIEDVLLDVEQRTKTRAKLVVTSAQPGKDSISYQSFRARLHTSTDSHVLLFGTGWGLADEIMDRAELRLEPVYGPGEYNHLSVRGAAAIIFDRLRGQHAPQKE
ncbi:MAG: hypothetical protein KDD44_11755, partial [Bdellovibrionales bacterium]|nr:hypothetical protein [Bdellovibrionales bacterium]